MMLEAAFWPSVIFVAYAVPVRSLRAFSRCRRTPA
jgi:hypothetical protein